MLSSSTTSLQEILEIAPEWRKVVDSLAQAGPVSPFELLNRLGAQAIYRKALAIPATQPLLIILRDHYYQGHLQKMVASNPNLRRFWSQRRIATDQQRDYCVSFSIELAQKLQGVLAKQLSQRADDGFKVLLPAYMQRSLHNAVVDYIRQEWSWERQTLQDLSLDPEQEDPRKNVAEDQSRAPEQLVISNEQVKQLNQLREQLKVMLSDPTASRKPLIVLDCIFGLGLTEYSIAGQELTMKECCEKLNIEGETQARRIARCQVHLDKGMDMVRQQIRQKLPGIAESWQTQLNVNTASRRELSQQLDMTEGEVERLIKGRQYQWIDELSAKNVVKGDRLPELVRKGAVAVFVPVDINSTTVRDLVDILGMPKEKAQKLVSERPFANAGQLVAKNLIDQSLLDQMLKRGAVLGSKVKDENRLDLNRVEIDKILDLGIKEDIAQLAIRGRPFLTWSELEDFLGCDASTWTVLRQKFCLGLTSG